MAGSSPEGKSWINIATLLVSLTALAVACYGGIEGKSQADAAQGQLTAMRNDQRPWVFADIVPGGRIFRNQSGGLTFPITFKLHNAGHLPALYVSPDIEAYLSGESGELGAAAARRRQKNRCDTPLQQPGATDQIGVTVFPGSSLDFGTGSGITNDQIASIPVAYRMSGFFPDVWIVGCIIYRAPDGSPHQTGVAFTVEMSKPGAYGVYALPSDPTSIDPEQIVLPDWITGGTAYAN